MSRETRDRPVIFRVSDSEYERMLAASGSSRSLSEFIREAVLAALDGGSLEQRVERLERHLDDESFQPAGSGCLLPRRPLKPCDCINCENVRMRKAFPVTHGD